MRHKRAAAYSTTNYTNRCQASGIFNTLLFVVYLADVFIDIKNSINFNTSGCFGSPFLSLLYTLLQGGFTSSVNNNNNNNNNGRALFYFEEMSRYYRRDTKLGKKLFSYICLLKRKSGRPIWQRWGLGCRPLSIFKRITDSTKWWNEFVWNPRFATLHLHRFECSAWLNVKWRK